MFSLFYPDEYLASTYDIDFEQLYESGYRGVLFDIDNTLVRHDAPADERAVEFFKRLKNTGFKSSLLSNNKKPRVASFAEDVGTSYIYKAGKPKPYNYKLAMERMGTDSATTLFVGDQIFTDILGANLAGMHTILVKPIDPHEEIQIVLKRYPEKLILFFYGRKMRQKGRRT